MGSGVVEMAAEAKVRAVAAAAARVGAARGVARVAVAGMATVQTEASVVMVEVCAVERTAGAGSLDQGRGEVPLARVMGAGWMVRAA